MVDKPMVGLKQINPEYLERNNFHGLVQVLMNMFFFLALLSVASFSQEVWLSIILIILIGIASHRLFFPAHDCMHESLFRSKRVNVICGYVLAGILGAPFQSMRDQHMLHHRYVGTEQDPGAGEYFVRFETRRQMIGFFIAPLLGVTVLTRLFEYAKRFSLRSGQIGKSGGVNGSNQSLTSMVLGILSVAGMQLTMCALLTQGFQFSRLWRYPVFSVIPIALGFLFLNRIRMFSEHGSIDYSKSDYTIGLRPTNRSIAASAVERILICGGNFNFHNEHHRFPRVPGYHLRRLHEELLSEMDPWDSRETYIGTLTELWRNLSPVRTQG